MEADRAEYKRQWRARNIERIKAREKKYYEANKEKLQKQGRKRSEAWRQNNPKKVRAYLLEHYNQRRNYFIDMLGGKCSKCGSKEKLEFHHVDRSTKKVDIGKILSHDIDKVVTEIAKCVLLCSSCHHKEHIAKGEWGSHWKHCVMCIETGKVYTSVTECSKDMNINHRCISSVCVGRNKQTHGYHFKYVEDD